VVANTPTPKSYPQLLGDSIDAVTSRIGIRRLKVGAPILSLLEAAAQADTRISADVFQMLLAQGLDNATGNALDRIGASEGVPRNLLSKATGTVTITDVSFNKVSSKIYPGGFAPIVGAVTINVENAAGWPSTGNVYVGRNTPNIEGPLHYTSITNAGTYYTLNLSTPTSSFHNLGETVVLAQGGARTVDAGTIVATPQGAITAAIQFSTLFSATIPDGEVQVASVAVVATVAGASGNAPANSVVQFTGSVPFTGATVNNPLPFTSGHDTETDNDYRDRIRKVRGSKSKGTALSIETAALGAISDTENKRVSSARIVNKVGQPSALYIDDGTGYEETWQGVGSEVLIDSAVGGEQYIETTNRPITKAFLLTLNVAPFVLVDGCKLSIRVGSVVTTHVFGAADFINITTASGYEVAASINANSALLWSARTLNSGSQVVITARAETNEQLQVVAVNFPDTDANAALAFPATGAFTTNLYKNDLLLSKDGSVAFLNSNRPSTWNALSGTQTLILSVDGTPAITYSIGDNDFVLAGTGFSGVGVNTLAAWVAVLNAKLPGVTTTSQNGVLVLTSNRGLSALSALSITGGTLVGNGVFAVGSSAGSNSDYSVDRSTGQIALAVPLTAGDRLSLGSLWTRGFINVTNPNITSNNVWFGVDSSAAVVPHSVQSSTPLTATIIGVTTDAQRVQLQSGAVGHGDFLNVLPEDIMVLWDSAIPSALRNPYKVVSTSVDGSGFVNKLVFEKREGQIPRFAHQAVAKADGTVVFTGGLTNEEEPSFLYFHIGTGPTQLVESYNPATGVWATLTSLTTPRWYHTSTLLQGGGILTVGGNAPYISTNTSEIDAVVGPTMSVARSNHSATLMANGRVLIAGGLDAAGAPILTSEEYDPIGNAFINVRNMPVAVHSHSAVLLPAGAGTAGADAGKVFIAGGVAGGGPSAQSAIYDPTTKTWTARASMPVNRFGFGMASVATQKVLAVGCGIGTFGVAQVGTYTVYDVSANTWTSSTAVASGWTFTEQTYGLVGDGTMAIAYGGCQTTGSVKALKPKQFVGGSLTWNDLPSAGTALFTSFGVDRQGCVGSYTSFGNRFCVFHGGVSANNMEANVTSASPGIGIAIATSETINLASGQWTHPDSNIATISALTLPQAGISFARSKRDLQQILLPTVSDANSLANAITAGVEGASGVVYKTSSVRIRTNTIGSNGSIVKVAGQSGTSNIPSGILGSSVVANQGSIESANSELGTPQGFAVYQMLGDVTDNYTTAGELKVLLPPALPLPNANSRAWGLQKSRDGLNPKLWQSTWAPGGDLSVKEIGNSDNTKMRVSAASRSTSGALNANGAIMSVSFRDKTNIAYGGAPNSPIVPNSPVLFANPFSISPRDTLTVVVDGDLDTKRFSIPMYRKIIPTGAYSIDSNWADGDNVGVQLATAFPTPIFKDFAVYMKARTLSHPGDSTKTAVWRYYRHGAEGNNVSLRYVYPDAASASVSVVVDDTQSAQSDINGFVPQVYVSIKLGSGAAATPSTIRSTSKMGLARCNQNGLIFDTYAFLGFSIASAARPGLNGMTALTLTVPNNGVIAQGPQGTGINVGDVLWLDVASPSVSTIYSGVFTVAQVDAFNAGTGQQVIYIPSLSLNDGTILGATSNPGTVSFDTAGLTSFTGAINNGDYFRIKNTGDFVPGAPGASYVENTMRIKAHGPQYILASMLANDTSATLTTPTWSRTFNPTGIQFFGASTQSATAVVAAVNALAAINNPMVPVTGVVTGSGGGVINQATWDELASGTIAYSLTDGLNYVKEHLVNFVSPGVYNSELKFKSAITSSLISNSDYANEDVRLVPNTAKNVVDWLNTLGVTGLSSVAEVSASSSGEKVQIVSKTLGSSGSVSVQGGLANDASAAVYGSARAISRSGTIVNAPASCSVTIQKGEAEGLIGGGWTLIQNQNTLPKLVSWNSATTATITPSGTAGSWLWTFSPSIFSLFSDTDEVRMRFEKYSGWSAIRISYKNNATLPFVALFHEGDYLYVCTPTLNRSDLPAVSLGNRGVFKILRLAFTPQEITLWVNNPNTVEETSVAHIKNMASSTPVPGDILSVSTAEYGNGNVGQWKITEVGSNTAGGEQYVNSTILRIDASAKTPQLFTPAAAMGADNTLIRLIEGVPTSLVKQIVSIAPNQTDGSFSDVQLDSVADYFKIGQTGGSVVTALDKLEFPEGVFSGTDGYSYSTGLVGEVNKIVYGDESDRATYPGYAAVGSSIITQGSLVRRAHVGLSLRVQSGFASADLAGRVKSAVATAINQTDVGTSCAISDLVAAASRVTGVIAVAVTSPTYSSTSDQLPVGDGEKLLVLDLDSDIVISYVNS